MKTIAEALLEEAEYYHEVAKTLKGRGEFQEANEMQIRAQTYRSAAKLAEGFSKSR